MTIILSGLVILYVPAAQEVGWNIIRHPNRPILNYDVINILEYLILYNTWSRQVLIRY